MRKDSPEAAHHRSPTEAAALDDGGAFAGNVAALTDAFGDPTRRRIYLLCRESSGGVSASDVAREVGIHPNVARHHLDKLAAGGYIEVAAGTVDTERRAGRPSKRFIVTAEASRSVADEVMPRHADALVLALLGQALSRLPADEAETMAEEVGASYGRMLASGLTGDIQAAGHRSRRSAVQAIAAALTAYGFDARASTGSDNTLRIINDNCPFGVIAGDHPVVCAVDRGLVRGMLSALSGSDEVHVATEASRARGDALCSTAV